MNLTVNGLKTLPLTFTIFSLFTFISITNISGSELPSLIESAVVIPKATPTISDATRSFLNSKNKETAKVWLYFTDKGISDRDGFRRNANTVILTERTLKRRAKMGLDKVLFVDLPVVQDYVNQVVELGGTHRRSSRWLNAASFELPMGKLDQIASLSFVASIKPMAGFQSGSQVDLEAASRPNLLPDALSPDALNYGSSFTQLNQVNVPNAHSRGLTGKGITLAIMDTGFRKTHESFAAHFAAGRVLGEYDFVFDDGNTANETGDHPSQWSHGTLIWSVSGGQKDGVMYGPAYEANFILCKTEDLRSETTVEEDNWVAAMEFADSIGTDVITTSLGYSDWYTFSDYDGQTATITIGANTATALGIVMCNSMGNSGPANSTLTAPADAFEILSVGAVNSAGTIAFTSSRGPTADGRPKPEVVAMGVGTFAALASGDFSYTIASGTSLSTPIVAGVACLVLEADPSLTPQQVRQVMMQTASRATNPDSTTYGFGIVNADSAAQAPAGPCCVNRTGNVDGDPADLTDIADLTFLIDHLFISFPRLACNDEANIDGDPGNTVTIEDLTVLIDHLFISFPLTAACP